MSEEPQPHEHELRDVGPNDREEASDGDVEDEDDGPDQHAPEERDPDEPFEDEPHHADLGDEVDDARDRDHARAEATKRLAVESIAHVVGQRKPLGVSKLLREEEEHDGDARNECEIGESRDGTDAAHDAHAAEDRSPVHDRRHVRHHQHRQSDAPARDPEIRGRPLEPGRDRADDDHDDEVEREEEHSDGLDRHAGRNLAKRSR